MTAIDISRQTSGVIFDKEVSSEIISKAIENSAIMQLAQRMPIAGNGKKYQTITGDPVPEWVGETAAKPVGKFDFGTKEVMPYKMALIVPFSNEFKRDKAALYAECINRLPKLFGRKFDATAMSTSAPGENFDVFGSAAKMSILSDTGISVYDRFVGVDAHISDADGIMTGIALAPKGRSIVLGAKDGDGKPLFTPGVQSGQVGDILGADVSVKKGVYVAGAAPATPAVVGLAGDFDECAYGVVEAIHGDISEEATLYYKNEANQDVTLALWQHNMFAVRFEIELALMIRDINKFALLTGEVPSTTTTTTTGA